MLNIKQAILHTFNINTQGIVLSQVPLDLSTSLNDFFLKHIQNAQRNQKSKQGLFYEDSDCAGIIQKFLCNERSFLDLTQFIAKKYFDAIKQSANINTINLFFCEFTFDEQSYIGILKYTSQPAFVATPGICELGDTNEIQLMEIIPNSSSKLEEFAFISCLNLSIQILPSKYNIDGNQIFLLPEAVLECTTTPSPQEAIQHIQRAADKVAKEYGRDTTETSAAVKKAITMELDEHEQLCPLATVEEIFPDNQEMQEACKKELTDKGYNEEQSVLLDKEKTLKKMMHHKLKTDTGIELTIPLDYFENAEFIEFENANDGSLTIILKHINNIMNRT